MSASDDTAPRLVDSHCHIDDEVFQADREAVIQRALEAGVERMLAIGTGDGPPDLEAGLRLARQYPFMRATVGVHPHTAERVTPETLERLRELAADPLVVAVGEIGLDYHYDNSPRDVQRNVFRQQMAIARDIGKPIVIHTREAWDDTFQLLEEEWAPAGLPGVLHCFTGGPDEAERAVGLGLYLGFGGVLTYPKALTVQEAARRAPLDRVLVETDAPYLAPVPKRGQRNEPAYVVAVAQRLAELRGLTLAAVARATTDNFDRLCGSAI